MQTYYFFPNEKFDMLEKYLPEKLDYQSNVDSRAYHYAAMRIYADKTYVIISICTVANIACWQLLVLLPLLPSYVYESHLKTRAAPSSNDLHWFYFKREQIDIIISIDRPCGIRTWYIFTIQRGRCGLLA